MYKVNEEVARGYYAAIADRCVECSEKYLHADVQLISPLAKLSGKKNVLKATEVFISQFKTLEVCKANGSKDKVTVIYDLVCPPPLGKITIKVLMTFLEKLIIRLELY